MNATDESVPRHGGTGDLPARIALKDEHAARGLLDGAWWPRSRDLLLELPPLAEALDPVWGRMTRIAVNPRYWPDNPRKVPVNGHLMGVGWFAGELDPHKVVLLSYASGRWDLLVIPPDTDAVSAGRLMLSASDSAGPLLTASALMVSEEARNAPETERPGDPEEAWEYEGGAISPHTAAPHPARRVTAGS